MQRSGQAACPWGTGRQGKLPGRQRGWLCGGFSGWRKRMRLAHRCLLGVYRQQRPSGGLLTRRLGRSALGCSLRHFVAHIVRQEQGGIYGLPLLVQRRRQAQ